MDDLLEFEAVTLTADTVARTFRASLLPYGETGSTNLGKLTATKGSIRIPKDPEAVVGRLGHDNPDQPAASQATQLVDADSGLMLAGRILESDEGDQLLADIEEGSRNMVSVEVAKPIIRDGRLVGGTLYAYAHVAAGAFPSAKLVAADHGDLDEQQARIDRLTAESIRYKQRAQTAEAEVERLTAELKAAREPDTSAIDVLRAELYAAVNGRLVVSHGEAVAQPGGTTSQ